MELVSLWSVNSVVRTNTRGFGLAEIYDMCGEMSVEGTTIQ